MKFIKLNLIAWSTEVYINIKQINAVTRLIDDNGDDCGTDIKVEDIVVPDFIKTSKTGVVNKKFDQQIIYKTTGVSLRVKEDIDEVMQRLADAGAEVYE